MKLPALTRGLSLALALALPHGWLAAQSVELYGVVDLGLATTSTGGPGGLRTTQLMSGIAHGAMWGMKGSEDLGGGTQLVWLLEQGFDADTGAAKPYRGDPASVTLEMPRGRVVSGSTGVLSSASRGRRAA